MIAIIDYGAGNVRSVQNALNRLGAENKLTADMEEIRAADRVILPGVGEASTAMSRLKEKGLVELIPTLNQPFLGICLGLQLMCKFSEEGNTDCLGIFDTVVKKFPPKDKVPHMGWNSLSQIHSPLFEGLTPSDYLYFVHGFYAEVCPESIANCDYIQSFSAAINKVNFYATQFHPEKSAEIGQRILENFLAI